MAVGKQYRRIFDPAQAGEFDLPVEVAAARAALDRFSAAFGTRPPPPPPGHAFHAAVATTLTADDPAGVDLSAIATETAQREQWDLRTRILRAAEQDAVQDLDAAVTDNANAIIECVSTAGTALWREIIESVRALGDVEISSSDALLRANAKVRSNWLDLDGLAAKYIRLRTALGDVPQPMPEHDVHGDHSEFPAGLCTVAGAAWRGMPSSPAPRMPWPDDPRGKIVWMVRNGHEPWFATAEQRDNAWMSTHRDVYEAMQERQMRHHTAQTWGSPANRAS